MPSRVRNKKCYGSMILITQHLQKWFIDSDSGTRALQTLGFYKLIFLFQVKKIVAWKKMKSSNISGNMQRIFFVLSPCVWENYRLNKND